MPFKRHGGLLLGLLLIGLSGPAHAALPRVAIVIDDLGNNRQSDDRVLKLPGRFTASILPFTPQATRDTSAAKARGLEIILHLPMQAENGKAMGKGGLDENMNEAQFRETVAHDMDAITGISGVSNHMGSRLTRNPQAMRWLMQAIKVKPLFFLDSRTVATSVAASTARSVGVPIVERNVFLDNTRNVADIEYQFDRMINIARQKGQVIAIGHPFPETLTILERRMPELEQQGLRLTTLSELVRNP